MTTRKIQKKVMKMTSEDRKVMSGFPSLDKIIGGFRPGSLNVIAGSPGRGKTGLALNIAYNAAVKYNKRVLFYSLEESKDEIQSKIALFASKNSLDTAKDLIFIDDRTGPYEEVQLNLRKGIEEIHPDLIIIDYLQLLVPLEENNERGIAKVTGFLWHLAADYEVPVIVLSQLHRGFERNSDKSTLRRLEEYKYAPVVQDADVIVILRWEDYGSDRENLVIDVHLDVAKNRFGDRDLTATVKWERAKFKFFEEE